VHAGSDGTERKRNVMSVGGRDHRQVVRVGEESIGRWEDLGVRV